MKANFIRITLIVLLYSINSETKASNTDSISRFDSLRVSPRPFIALGEIVALNLSVWSIDRYITKADYAYINSRTIKNNFKEGFVWDNDLFGTNFILHPYHGSMYFNTARSNGYSFYSSVPFAFTGSLMWEYIFEREPPSINDLMATTAGGSAIGEVTHRLSSRVFDNSQTGAKRVIREVLGTVISPISGLNRLISGEAWKHSPQRPRDLTPIDWKISLGCQLLKPRMQSSHLPYMQLATTLEYNPDYTECEKPYDWFELNARINVRPNSIYVNRMHILGLLWNKDLKESNSSLISWGLYQHFDYLDSPVKEYQRTPYRLSQVLALGPGIRYKTVAGNRFAFEGKAFFTGIGLGASISDHYWAIDRDYNFGSGFSTKLNLLLSDLDNGLYTRFSADNFQLFTWKGYAHDRNLYQENPTELDAQGDKGSVNFTFMEMELGYQSDNGWNLSFIPAFINRSTYYKYYPSVKYSTWEFTLKVGYKI